jgi:hypothetical protein
MTRYTDSKKNRIIAAKLRRLAGYEQYSRLLCPSRDDDDDEIVDHDEIPPSSHPDRPPTFEDFEHLEDYGGEEYVEPDEAFFVDAELEDVGVVEDAEDSVDGDEDLDDDEDDQEPISVDTAIALTTCALDR